MCILRSPILLAPILAAGTACGAAPAQHGSEAPAGTDAADFTFSRTTWTDDGPVAREHGALFGSADGRTLYLLSGGGYPNYPDQEMVDDAWRFDVASATWSPWEVSGDVPPALASRRVAQASGDVAFLYGGYDSAFNSDGELFSVDLASGVFTRVAQSTPAPAPRSLHAFAYDESRRQLMVFGGFLGTPDTQDILGDTWLGNVDLESHVVDWAPLEGPSPSPRYGMFAGYDPSLRRLVVFSGAGFPVQGDPINAAQDTWVLSLDDAPQWTALNPLGDTPPGRRNGCGVVDPVTHALLVFGGTADGATSQEGAFLLDLRHDGSWRRSGADDVPPVRSSSFGAARPGGGFVCGFGNDSQTFRDLFFLQ